MIMMIILNNLLLTIAFLVNLLLTSKQSKVIKEAADQFGLATSNSCSVIMQCMAKLHL